MQGSEKKKERGLSRPQQASARRTPKGGRVKAEEIADPKTVWGGRGKKKWVG